jgi:hypothetical protein
LRSRPLSPSCFPRLLVALACAALLAVAVAPPVGASTDVEIVDVQRSADGRYRIEGRAPPGTRFTLFVNDLRVAAATADAKGVWVLRFRDRGFDLWRDEMEVVLPDGPTLRVALPDLLPALGSPDAAPSAPAEPIRRPGPAGERPPAIRPPAPAAPAQPAEQRPGQDAIAGEEAADGDGADGDVAGGDVIGGDVAAEEVADGDVAAEEVADAGDAVADGEAAADGDGGSILIETSDPEGGLVATRRILVDGRVDAELRDAGAFGMLMFVTDPNAENRPRRNLACRMFLSGLTPQAAAEAAGVPVEKRMVTFWPVRGPWDREEATCAAMIERYDVLLARRNLRVVERVLDEDGLMRRRGPFLAAWSPPASPASERVFLLMDLSPAETPAEFERAFRVYRDRIERAPELWSEDNVWDLERIRRELRAFLERNSGVFRLFAGG